MRRKIPYNYCIGLTLAITLSQVSCVPPGNRGSSPEEALDFDDTYTQGQLLGPALVESQLAGIEYAYDGGPGYIKPICPKNKDRLGSVCQSCKCTGGNKKDSAKPGGKVSTNYKLGHCGRGEPAQLYETMFQKSLNQYCEDEVSCTCRVNIQNSPETTQRLNQAHENNKRIMLQQQVEDESLNQNGLVCTGPKRMLCQLCRCYEPGAYTQLKGYGQGPEFGLCGCAERRPGNHVSNWWKSRSATEIITEDLKANALCEKEDFGGCTCPMDHYSNRRGQWDLNIYRHRHRRHLMNRRKWKRMHESLAEELGLSHLLMHQTPNQLFDGQEP